MVRNGIGQLFRQHLERFPALLYQLVPALGFLLIDGIQLLPEYLIGQSRLDGTDAILVEIPLGRVSRPRHHVDMRVFALIVEGGVPAEIIQRYFHGGGDFALLGQQKVAPSGGVVVAQPLGVTPLEGEDVCPHSTGILLQLCHRSRKINRTFYTEQAMDTDPLRPGAGGDIAQVLSCCRGSLRQKFHPIPGCDVLHVTVRSGFFAADVRTLDDQSSHSSPSSIGSVL